MKMLIEKYRLWLSWLIYVFCFLIVYWRLSEHYFIMRDDVSFTFMAHSQNLFDYLRERYVDWSSRVIVEIFVYLFCYLPQIVWKIGMSLCFLGCGAGFCYLLNVKNLWHRAVVLLAVMTIPNVYLNNSGWIVTTAFYLIPLFFSIWSLCSISDIYYCRKIGFIKATGYFMATLIAANMEQNCFLLGCLAVCAFLYFLFKQKKINFVLGAQLIAVGINVAMFLGSAGNQVRYVSEVQKSLPEYASWSIGQKIIKSMEHLGDDFFFDPYLLSLIFIAVLLVCNLAYRESKLRFHIVIGCATLLSCLVIYAWKFHQAVYPVGDNHLGWLYIFPLLIVCGMTAEFVLSGKYHTFCYVLAGLFIGGILSSLLIAFSPTIYTSNVRVFIIFLYALLFVVLYLYVHFGDKIRFAHWFMGAFIIFWTVYNVLVNDLL